MNKKTILAVSWGLASLISLHTNAFAQVIGYVDPAKVMRDYKVVQDVEESVRQRDIEARRFVEDADLKIRNAKTPLEKENLEKTLTSEYRKRYQDLEAYKLDQSKKINDAITVAIKSIATEQNLDVVLSKAAIYVGGLDVTDKVLVKLNSVPTGLK